jgi:uncharacterized protein YcbK (DUF882 family)
MMNNTEWLKTRYFTADEFASPDQPGSGDMMDKDFINRLVLLRERMKKPFWINSGYRTPKHNRAVGGAANSAHVRGRACDIRWFGWTGPEKTRMAMLAKQLGFTGIGRANSFIHLDDMQAAEGYPRPAEWTYGNRPT